MTEKWRYRCPKGHVTWESRQSDWKESKSDYYCRSCQKAGENPHFNELVDAKAL